MGLLTIDNLKLTLGGKAILNGLSLDLWEGYVHAIVGPNGAGKSTLAFTIMGLEGYTDFAGEMRFNGTDLKDVPLDERARLGITLGWQEPARFEGLTVEQFLRAGSPDATDESLRAILDSVGLPPQQYFSRAVDKTLSGGERKKVELASILALKPKLVMLDEPDSGIDVDSLRRIHDAITLLREAGTTVLLITHSTEVLSWAEHAFLVCHGTLLDKGPADEIARYFHERCITCTHKNDPTEDEVNV